ncbi:Rai1p [Malassezia vespertilionis]|uniref:Decapping nuclease n=2 Tax=Malassezia vespertilionis TaxID=2020962 RepID=A0A2N1JES3_9BASI|nr:Rai1p [Malassezia vespertilionis]
MRTNEPSPAASLQQPTLVGSFSYDASKALHFDNSSKRWFREPPTERNHGNGTGRAADLNFGFDAFTEKVHTPDPLDSLLYTLMHRASTRDSASEIVRGAPQVGAELLDAEVLRTNVITWRGIMTKLCTAWSCHPEAPKAFREGFDLNVMMLGNTLFMEEVPPTAQEAQALARQRKPRRLQKAMYYGYSFESFCTEGATPKPSAAQVPGWGGDVNTNVQWCHIVKSRLGDNRVMIGGEVDCVEESSSGADETVVELKTNMQLRNEEDEFRLHVKMLRMYMQSFLLGVKTIVIGFRDEHGQLLDAKHYRTADLPRIVRDKKGRWDANHNLAFGAHILNFLRTEIGAEMERWCFRAVHNLRAMEETHGAYPWHVHRTAGSFLGHLPLPCPRDAELEYPVFRVSFQPPFSQLTLRLVSPQELELDGRRQGRCGLVPTEFYRWATQPMTTQ